MASMDNIALLELIPKIGLKTQDVDFLREGLNILAEAVMDTEISDCRRCQGYRQTLGTGL
jgi:hypothetical protein